MTTIDDVRDKPVMSVPEAGELLGLTRATAYRFAQRGQLPVIRLGRKVVVPTRKLLDMLGYDDEGRQ